MFRSQVYLHTLNSYMFFLSGQGEYRLHTQLELLSSRDGNRQKHFIDAAELDNPKLLLMPEKISAFVLFIEKGDKCHSHTGQGEL